MAYLQFMAFVGQKECCISHLLTAANSLGNDYLEVLLVYLLKSESYSKPILVSNPIEIYNKACYNSAKIGRAISFICYES